MALGDLAYFVKTDSWRPEGQAAESGSPGAYVPPLPRSRTRGQFGWYHLEFRNPKAFAQITPLPRDLGLLLSRFATLERSGLKSLAFLFSSLALFEV